jgi:hypothetical protein
MKNASEKLNVFRDLFQEGRRLQWHIQKISVKNFLVRGVINRRASLFPFNVSMNSALIGKSDE